MKTYGIEAKHLTENDKILDRDGMTYTITDLVTDEKLNVRFTMICDFNEWLLCKVRPQAVALSASTFVQIVGH
jgi:hypothetical protein